jgi:hypothetical protein
MDESIEKSWGYTLYVDEIIRTYGTYMDWAILNNLGKYVTLSYTYSDSDYDEHFDKKWDYSMFTIGLKNIEELFRK